MDSDLGGASESLQEDTAPAPALNSDTALRRPGEEESPPKNRNCPCPPTSAAPPPKGLLELLVAPVTLAVVTTLAGSFAVALNSRIQKAETDRAFRASQIDAVVKVRPPATPAEVNFYARRLAAYGEFAIPLLTAALQTDEESDRVEAERSLIQIALLSGKTAEVGRAMAIILQDKWQTYDRLVHRSALRIISAICYGEASPILASYSPKDVVKKWDQVRGIPAWVEDFNGVLEKARALAKSCTTEEREARQ